MVPIQISLVVSQAIHVLPLRADCQAAKNHKYFIQFQIVDHLLKL